MGWLTSARLCKFGAAFVEPDGIRGQETPQTAVIILHSSRLCIVNRLKRLIRSDCDRKAFVPPTSLAVAQRRALQANIGVSLQMKLLAPGRHWLLILGVVPIVYFLLAYLILPAAWMHHEHEPGLANLPMVTRTGDGIPGDALNVGLVGNEDDITRAMHAADCFPADPITLRTSIEIIGSVMLDRPYRDAPVSPLYYQGKKEQLAFEKPDGKSADRRHHVRLWQGP